MRALSLTTTRSRWPGLLGERRWTSPPAVLTKRCNITFVKKIYNSSLKALVEACQRLGVTFVGEDEVQGTVRIVDSRGSGPPCLKTFHRLHILDFDSTRKRMSVIVRNPSGSLVLVTKGAESSVLPLCTAGPVLEVNRSIDEYAVQGLRSENCLSW